MSPPGGADSRQTGVSTLTVDGGNDPGDLSQTDLATLDNEEVGEQ